MRQRIVVLSASLIIGAACEKPAESVSGAFAIRASPDPIVFRQLYPGATALGWATPPPHDPGLYTARVLLTITEQRGGVGHLERVQTTLVSSDGQAIPAGSYDGGCDDLRSLFANRTIPPLGRLEWCMDPLARPDPAREYTLQVTAHILDGRSITTTPSENFRVVFRR